jgi:hypothetical protein
VSPGILSEEDGIDVGAGNDLRGEGTIGVIGAEQKRLDGALCETVQKGKKEEKNGDPVQSDSQILEPGRSEQEKRVGLGGPTITHDGFYYDPYPTGSKHVGRN